MTPGGTEMWSETSRYDQRDCPSFQSRPAGWLRTCGAAHAARQCRTARLYHDGKADIFAYDPAGQVTAAAYGRASQQVESALAVNPTENGKQNTDKLLWHQTYNYDPAGNRTKFTNSLPSDSATENGKPKTDTPASTEYVTNSANQYTSLTEQGPDPSTLEPRYDANGNLLNDTRNTYTWDADIHLLSVSTQPSPTTANNGKPQQTHFRYDALHRRVARLELKPAENGTPKTEHEQTLTHFIHDGWNVLQERISNHESKIINHKSFVWSHDISGKPQGAGGIGGLLKSVTIAQPSSPTAQPQQAVAPATFHYDSNGNVVLLTSPEGKESAHYAYDAFGKTMLATGPLAQENEYRFSTKPVEDGSGLCFYGFRFYSPALGRWLSRDPIAERGGHNIYAMVLNRPTALFDVLGLSCESEQAKVDEILKNLKQRREQLETLDAVMDGASLQEIERIRQILQDSMDALLDKYGPAVASLAECQKNQQALECVAVGAGAAVVGYGIYRCCRMVPSLFPPLWPTIPANIAIP
jgi:RHS repeat-associated protein